MKAGDLVEWRFGRKVYTVLSVEGESALVERSSGLPKRVPLDELFPVDLQDADRLLAIESERADEEARHRVLMQGLMNRFRAQWDAIHKAQGRE